MSIEFEPNAISKIKQEEQALAERKAKLIEQLRKAVPANFREWQKSDDPKYPNLFIDCVLDSLFSINGFSMHGFRKYEWEKFGPEGYKKLFELFKELEAAWQGVVKIETKAEGWFFEVCEEKEVRVEFKLP